MSNSWSQSIIDHLVQLESEILYQLPPLPGELEFNYIPGSIPVLLSAPHGAVHTRNGKLKDEDEYSAAFARFVAEMTGAHVLYACRKSGTDPNWYPDAPYKQALKQVVETARIKFVLDIHGASARREFGLALGTMLGASCPEQRELILENLEMSGFTVNNEGLNFLDLDHTFTGTGGEKQETITRFSWQRLKVPAAQIEVNAHLRVVWRKPDASLPKPFAGNPERIRNAVLAVQNLVRALSI